MSEREWTEEEKIDLVTGDLDGFEVVDEKDAPWKWGRRTTVVAREVSTGQFWRVSCSIHHSEGIQDVNNPEPVEAVNETVVVTKYMTEREREKAAK